MGVFGRFLGQNGAIWAKIGRFCPKTANFDIAEKRGDNAKSPTLRTHAIWTTSNVVRQAFGISNPKPN
jgi:hypothetical protein